MVTFIANSGLNRNEGKEEKEEKVILHLFALCKSTNISVKTSPHGCSKTIVMELTFQYGYSLYN